MSSIRLFVDDSSAMRKMVERALRMADVEIAQVFEAGNGKEALSVLQDNALDLILCDINMPEMNGLEFLKRRPVDSGGRGVPVIMITSESGESDVVAALSSGASGYIRKPFTPRQVREQIIPLSHTKGLRSPAVDELRVLIVDDSSVMRKMIEHGLRKAGIQIGQVLGAFDGLEALALLNNDTVDLILCDINMPVMSGLELLQQLCATGIAKGAPVIMITTEGGESEVVQALAYGARGYIRKPFAAEQIRDQILPVLAHKS